MWVIAYYYPCGIPRYRGRDPITRITVLVPDDEGGDDSESVCHRGTSHSRGRSAGDTDAVHVSSIMESVPTMIEQVNGKADTLDELLDALSHPYRRRILDLLFNQNPRDEAEFSANELADDADEFDRLVLEIHHRHLPKLAEADFIDWDREADVITRGPRFEEIAPLIELMVNHRDELPAGWP